MVLVLGGRGFIGKALVRDLVSWGVEVRLLTRVFPPALDIVDGVEYRIGDLLDESLSLYDLLLGCSVVINCAGELKNKELMYQLHVTATSKLVQAAIHIAKRDGVSIHWVQLSSVGAYGPAKSPLDVRIITEYSPAAPKGVYEETKTLADDVVRKAEEAGFFSYSILRPSNVFGPYMPNDSLRQLALAVRKRVFVYIGAAGAVSTYIHVDDVSAGLIECAFNDKAKGNIFNISYDCSQEELIEGVAKSIGAKSPTIRFPYFLMKIIVFVFGKFRWFPLTRSRLDSMVSRTTYTSDKAFRILGFLPKKYPPDFISDVFVR